jgi:hypothetical protein
MALSSLAKSSCIVFGVFLVLVLFSKLSMTESLTGAYGRKQAEAVCRSALKRALFYSEASAQDDSLVLALLHSCEAKASAQASRDLAEKMGVVLGQDSLAILEEQQDRIDEICAALVEEGV